MTSLKRAPHVLVAEPEQSDLEFIIESLRADTQIEISFGRAGWEVMDVLKSSGRPRSAPMPSVLLLDLELSDPGGLEMIRLLRGCLRTRCLPIVALCGSGNKRLVSEAYEAGANSCLVKPARPEEFEEMIRRVIQYWLRLNQLPHNLGAEPA